MTLVAIVAVVRQRNIKSQLSAENAKVWKEITAKICKNKNKTLPLHSLLQQMVPWPIG